MKFTSGLLYALALLFAMATVQAQDCDPTADTYTWDGVSSDGTDSGGGSYHVGNPC
ncbi:hypothetical protein M413DRAFT_447587 [Hebeloma cylindrosporum]|uniref:Uncharacterized protein n=1 Tax=Hebeloma cylindrosporum TaxID=76867 RepID=A0A0C3BQK0_HEBCY|nr:hypothetical protein M413DRAFT_447587 [Hebeloma cylindrosporum h7]